MRRLGPFELQPGRSPILLLTEDLHLKIQPSIVGTVKKNELANSMVATH